MQQVLTQLCQRVRAARESGTTLFIQGGNTKAFYGEPIATRFSTPGADPAAAPATGQKNAENAGAMTPIPSENILDLSAYRGIINYEPSELVITARAGTPLSEIEATLAQKGQALAFEPPRFGAASTLGGCVAAGLSGPRRMAVGKLGDFILGARLLHSSGEVMSFGGEVMKNVAGYDVSRLLAGSLGSLGPIVEVSVKVLPITPCEQTRRIDIDEAGALGLFNTWRGLPLPLSATAWVPAESRSGTLYVRLSGSRPAVDSAIAQVGGDALSDDAAAAFWDSMRDQTHPFFAQRPLWRIAVPPTTGTLDLGPTLIEWNGGLRWVSTPMAASELRSKVQACGGHATLYRYDNKPADVPVFHPLSSALERINRRMMEQFDPTGIFNTGRRFPVVQG